MLPAVVVDQNIEIYPHYPAADRIEIATAVCAAILLVTFELPRKNDNKCFFFNMFFLYNYHLVSIQTVIDV